MSQAWLMPLLYTLLNIVSASGIVFANKVVFSVYNFNFTCTLTLIHTLFTIVGLRLFVALNVFKLRKVDIPASKVAPLALAFVAYVVFCNWNLNMNSVGFYQVSKILVAPAVLLLEAVLFQKYPTTRIVLAVVMVCFGIGFATVTDAKMAANVKGLLVGLGAVFATAMYQIWAGSKQKELDIGSSQLLYVSTPLAALALAIIAPCVEPTGLLNGAPPDSLLGFTYTWGAVGAILLSAALGLLVSLSTFLVIGATSSLTYNIVGHVKTIIILAGGCIFFGDEMPAQKLWGIGMAMCGIVWFSQLKLQAMFGSRRLPIVTSPKRHMTGQVLRRLNF